MTRPPAPSVGVTTDIWGLVAVGWPDAAAGLATTRPAETATEIHPIVRTRRLRM
jgi:hypothetical protein